MENKDFSFNYFDSLNSDLKYIKYLHILILVIFGLCIFVTYWVTLIDNKILNIILFLGVLT